MFDVYFIDVKKKKSITFSGQTVGRNSVYQSELNLRMCGIEKKLDLGPLGHLSLKVPNVKKD